MSNYSREDLMRMYESKTGHSGSGMNKSMLVKILNLRVSDAKPVKRSLRVRRASLSRKRKRSHSTKRKSSPRRK